MIIPINVFLVNHSIFLVAKTIVGIFFEAEIWSSETVVAAETTKAERREGWWRCMWVRMGQMWNWWCDIAYKIQDILIRGEVKSRSMWDFSPLACESGVASKITWNHEIRSRIHYAQYYLVKRGKHVRHLKDWRLPIMSGDRLVAENKTGKIYSYTCDTKCFSARYGCFQP